MKKTNWNTQTTFLILVHEGMCFDNKLPSINKALTTHLRKNILNILRVNIYFGFAENCPGHSQEIINSIMFTVFCISINRFWIRLHQIPQDVSLRLLIAELRTKHAAKYLFFSWGWHETLLPRPSYYLLMHMQNTENIIVLMISWLCCGQFLAKPKSMLAFKIFRIFVFKCLVCALLFRWPYIIEAHAYN